MEVILSDQTRAFPKHLCIGDPVVALKMNTASSSSGLAPMAQLYHTSTKRPSLFPEQLLRWDCWHSTAQGRFSACDLLLQLCFLVTHHTDTLHLQLRKESTPQLEKHLRTHHGFQLHSKTWWSDIITSFNFKVWLYKSPGFTTNISKHWGAT